MSNPTWFSVARRPKWIGALALALFVAVIFALLGQWQLERTFTVTEIPKNEISIDLLEVATPNQPITTEAANKLVKAEIYFDLSNVYIVTNRLQGEDSIPGYWVIANSSALLDGGKTASLTVVIGFAQDLEQAEKSRLELMNSIQVEAFIERSGRYIQTEAPVALPDSTKDYLFGSLSLAQLINLYSEDPIDTFAGIFVIDSEPGFGLERVSIAPPKAGTEVNWLTLFYAVEWALFAGFAIFLWWRLVEDERVREQK
ncbi:MAG: SURF1 family cytochrome oxidase biogenesis protein [Actinomycetota bacterium]